MEIKTKFALGDTVWVVDSSQAKTMTVESIHIFPTGITYSLSELRESRYENECFASKEELLRYVAGE